MNPMEQMAAMAQQGQPPQGGPQMAPPQGEGGLPPEIKKLAQVLLQNGLDKEQISGILQQVMQPDPQQGGMPQQPGLLGQ